MRFIERIRLGEEIPRTHRLAWYDHGRRRAVCFPLGLHWLMIIARRLWLLTYTHSRPDRLERLAAPIARQRDEAEADLRQALEFCRELKREWEWKANHRKHHRRAFLALSVFIEAHTTDRPVKP